MKRPLFVFAGQSNMMGAAVFEITHQVNFDNSAEYLHKRRRFGEKSGEFKNYGFPVGEFVYKSLEEAYGQTTDYTQKSSLNDYGKNTFFGPSMCNVKSKEEKTVCPFAEFSEADNRLGPSMAPYIVKGLEEMGYACAYTHIAKGGVPITHFLEGDAADYFDQKVTDFFAEAREKYADDDTSEKILVWHQGETDAKNGYDHYRSSLDLLWERAQKLGFTKFFMVRIGYFGTDSVTDVMAAQEDFCYHTDNAYMITRVASFIPWPKQDRQVWFAGDLGEELEFCRDSFYGFANNHINEKGLKLIAKKSVDNIVRILFENKAPILEDEMIAVLKK